MLNISYEEKGNPANVPMRRNSPDDVIELVDRPARRPAIDHQILNQKNSFKSEAANKVRFYFIF